MMASEENNDFIYNGEQGQAPPPDAFTIEELPDPEPESEGDSPQHDQLPNVEEYKTANGIQSHGRSRKSCLLALAFISLVSLTIGAIVVVTKKSKKNGDVAGRTKQVEDFLVSKQVSTLQDLQDINSAQHRAAAFIADGDNLHMPLTVENTRRFVERYVLAVLFYEFNGPNWTYNLKFLSGVDHCDWHDDFETGAGNIIRQGVICNEDKHVTELKLGKLIDPSSGRLFVYTALMESSLCIFILVFLPAWNNLKGTQIPRQIGYLQDLVDFHLYYNDIGGYFPTAFRQMKSLKGIGLMRTGMMGSLPEWIGEMTQLTTLGLGDNKLSGEIPDSIENLQNLRILGLDGNGGLKGNIEKLKKLSGLEALYLENNALTGILKDFNWPNLLELDVSNNMLSGSITAELLNHPKLVVLDIHQNMMLGSFPDDIFQNDKLEYLSLHKTGLSGTVPDRLGFLENLKHLDISFNSLNGTIPDTLTQLTNLHYWDTAGNEFSSQPMPDLRKMSNLSDLSMKSNSLTGSIPVWIGGLTSLQLLDLDSNDLKGSIPSQIGLLKELDFLLLNRNELSGTLPTQMKNLVQLQVFLLDGNSISGNANVICQDSAINIGYFIADCYPGLNGEKPEIECRCCTQCCTDQDSTCNDKQWTSTLDPEYEYGYIRSKYSFNLENAPASYSKQSAP